MRPKNPLHCLRNFFGKLACAFLLGALLSSPAPVKGQEMLASAPDENGVFVIKQDVRDLLMEYGRRIGVKPQISAKVDGEVQNRFLPTDGTRFLQVLAHDYQIEWYFEGTSLYVSALQENTTRLVDIGSLSLEAIEQEVEKTGIDPARFPLTELPEANAVMVKGPPSYIARIEVMVEALLKARADGTDHIQVIRYGLKSKESNDPQE